MLTYCKLLPFHFALFLAYAINIRATKLAVLFWNNGVLGYFIQKIISYVVTWDCVAETWTGSDRQMALVIFEITAGMRSVRKSNQTWHPKVSRIIHFYVLFHCVSKY